MDITWALETLRTSYYTFIDAGFMRSLPRTHTESHIIIDMFPYVYAHVYAFV